MWASLDYIRCMKKKYAQREHAGGGVWWAVRHGLIYEMLTMWCFACVSCCVVQNFKYIWKRWKESKMIRLIRLVLILQSSRIKTEYENILCCQLTWPRAPLFQLQSLLICTEQSKICWAVRNIPMKYLGLPLSIKKPTKVEYLRIIQKIQQRLTGWKSKLLLLVSRAPLVKSVLNALPLHFMHTFALPAWHPKQPCLTYHPSSSDLFLPSGVSFSLQLKNKQTTKYLGDGAKMASLQQNLFMLCSLIRGLYAIMRKLYGRQRRHSKWRYFSGCSDKIFFSQPKICTKGAGRIIPLVPCAECASLSRQITSSFHVTMQYRSGTSASQTVRLVGILTVMVFTSSGSLDKNFRLNSGAYGIRHVSQWCGIFRRRKI